MKFIFIFFLIFSAIESSCQVDEYNLIDNEKFRIVVFPFTTDTKNGNDGEIISKLVRSRLANATSNQKIIILEREAISSLFEDKKAGEKLPTYFDSNTAFQLGKLLYANYIVIGEVMKNPLNDNKEIVVARIIKSENGRIENSINVELLKNSNQNIDSIVNKIVDGLIQIIPEEYKIAPQTTSESYNLYLKSILNIVKSNKYYIKEIDSTLLSHPKLDLSKKIIGVLHYSNTDSRKKKGVINQIDEVNEVVIFNEEGVYYSIHSPTLSYFGSILWYDCFYQDLPIEDEFQLLISEPEDFQPSSHSVFDINSPLVKNPIEEYYGNKAYLILVNQLQDSKSHKMVVDTIKIFDKSRYFYIVDSDKKQIGRIIRKPISEETFSQLSNDTYLSGPDYYKTKVEIARVSMFDMKTLIQQGKNIVANYKQLIIKLHTGEYKAPK